MDPAACPPELQITTTGAEASGEEGARPDPDGVVMSIRHRELPVFGLQFHPESYMTPAGQVMIENWLTLVRAGCRSESGEKDESDELVVEHA